MKDVNIMGWKKTLLGLGVGVAAGVLLQKKVDNVQYVSGATALKNAKAMFKNKSDVIGSWIYMVPEKVERFNISYDVYRAGVNTRQEDTIKNYELLLDAKTGAILDVTERV